MTSEVFGSSPELRHIEAVARGALCAPSAVLASTLALAATTAPANLVLPPIVGSPSKASNFVALVGPPGAGKSVAQSVARQLVPDAPSVGLGSGEAVFKIFLESGPTDEGGRAGPMQLAAHPTVLGVYDEGEQLLASVDRQGSTLGATVRSAWIGALLSSVIAGASQGARKVPPYRYQLSLLIGLQPALCGPLIEDRSGLTDRLVFAEVIDRTLDPEDMRVEPKPIVPLRREDFDPITIDGANFPAMKVAAEIESDIRQDRVRRAKGEHVPKPFDGHQMLSQLKVAAGLALLHRRAAVEAIDWELARLIGERSSQIRERLIEQAAETRKAAAVEQGELSAVRSQAFDKEYLGTVCDRIRNLIADGHTGRSQIDRKLSPKQRPYREAALDSLIDQGEIRRIREEDGYETFHASVSWSPTTNSQ